MNTLAAGPRRRSSAGCCCSRAPGVHASYFPGLFFAFLLIGLGAGASFLPLLTIGMSDAPARDAGLASGIINVSVQLFGAIGLATLGTIATDHTKSLSASGHSLVSALTGGYHLAYVVAAMLRRVRHPRRVRRCCARRRAPCSRRSTSSSASFDREYSMPEPQLA